HCSTCRPAPVVIRWQIVLSKYFCLARLTKLFTAHGASALSRVMLILPTGVSSSTFCLPVVVTLPLAGGLTFLAARWVSFLSVQLTEAGSGVGRFGAGAIAVGIEAGFSGAAGVVADGVDDGWLAAGVLLPPLIASSTTTPITTSTDNAAVTAMIERCR